jgi:hypothetical protein
MIAQVRIVAVLACLFPLGSAQTDAGLWRFVHPNAKALIGIDVQRIRTSRVAAEMATQWNSMLATMPLQIPGMDLLKSIDRVVISSPGPSSAGTTGEPALLIAVSGRFEPEKLRKMLLKSGSKPQEFHSVTIFRPQDSASKDFGFVVLNSQTLLIGDMKSLCSTIERVEHDSAATPPGIVDRAHDMDVAYDFWAILLMPPSSLGGDRFPMANMDGKLNGLEAGIAVRDGFAFDVNLHAMSEPAAKEIAAQFSKLVHLAAKDRENHPEWAGLDRKLKIVIEHADVHFALRLDTREVARMTKSLSDGWERGRTLALGDAVPQLLETPIQPKKIPEPPLVIRIDGLDEGPRQIPYKPLDK